MFPAPFRVVLDANVIYPFTLRDTLLRAAAEGWYQVYWWVEILDEEKGAIGIVVSQFNAAFATWGITLRAEEDVAHRRRDTIRAALVLSLSCTGLAKTQRLTAQASAAIERGHDASAKRYVDMAIEQRKVEEPPQLFVVPYELVRAMWRDPLDECVFDLALQGSVVWQGTRWAFEPTS